MEEDASTCRIGRHGRAVPRQRPGARDHRPHGVVGERQHVRVAEDEEHIALAGEPALDEHAVVLRIERRGVSSARRGGGTGRGQLAPRGRVAQ